MQIGPRCSPPAGIAMLVAAASVHLLALVERLPAQHTHEHTAAAVTKPRVFLDKSARIVQYQLRRLSNAQLLLVDRMTDDPKYGPVYAEILARAGMSMEPREEAARGLAAIKGTSVAEELLATLAGLDPADRNQQLVFRQLTRMLLDLPVDELRGQLDVIRAAVAEPSPAQAAALAATLQLGLHEQAWRGAAADEARRLAYLRAIVLLPSPDSRSGLRGNVAASLAEDQPPAIRRAAIEALVEIPGRRGDDLQALLPLIDVPPLRDTVIRALLKLPDESWPLPTVSQLAEQLVAHVESIPAAERTSVVELNGLQLADNLLARLPASQSRPLRERLREVTVRVVQIGTVHEEMRYDKDYFAVAAGRPVQIVLRNEDAMPHNLVITAPQELRSVAALASQMSSQPGASGKQYVPDSELVLRATGMVQPGEQERLVFDAPATPGYYPFVCTFPQHWMRMYGVMVVVEDLDAWLARPEPPPDPLGNTRPIVQQWVLDDFGEIADGLRGRTRDIGQRLFTEATCAQCHKVQGFGSAVGPELTDVLARWKGDTRAVLREILEPSYKIEPKFAMYTVITAKGEVLSGVVTAQDSKQLTLVTNPESPQPRSIARDDIDEIIQATTSLMPKGLLDRFSRDEIFELLAYITNP